MTQQTTLFPSSDTHDTGCKRFLYIPAHWMTAAVFGGPNDCYRYKLAYVWGDDKPEKSELRELLLRSELARNSGDSLRRFFGPLLGGLWMNPSGAGIEIGDGTVLKFSRIAKRLRYRGIVVANACAYRAKDKARLLEVEDPVGPENLSAIKHVAENVDKLIVGHGKLPGKLQRHADYAVNVLRQRYQLWAFGFSDSGIPLHPMTLGKKIIPEDSKPVLWEEA